MTSCPFAQWLHHDGDDKNFSFGISVNNGFNCFTCGMKGSIIELPRKLARFTHAVPYDMEDFIRDNMDFTEPYAHSTNYTCYNKDILNKFEEAQEVLSLTKEDIAKWEIKQSNYSLLFPVFRVPDELIAIKVRMIAVKAFYFLLNNNMKESGIWYGQHFSVGKTLALVEGERDAILLSRYMPAWACLGMPTKAQIEAIKGVRAKNIILFFDNDDAGRQMQEKVGKELSGLFKLYRVKDYLDCKDPAELVEKNLIEQVKFVRL